MELPAVAALQIGSRDPLGRVLGMQIKRPPHQSRAELALEPRRPLKADVAERSYVVAPHGDPRRAVCSLDHPAQLVATAVRARTACTMASASIPAACISSAGFPDIGISRTASRSIAGRPA